MNEHLSTTLRVITVMVIGFITNCLMSQIAAPGRIGTALGVGVLLTSFGFVFARHVMEVVTLPFAIVSMVLRFARGIKNKPHSVKSKDRLDFFGRALFVVSYGFVSAVTGIFIGAMDDGMGWFTTSALFGTVGILLAVLVPQGIMWVTDSDIIPHTPSPAHDADMEQARKNGDPAALFVDRVAKTVIDTILEKPRPDDKR